MLARLPDKSFATGNRRALFAGERLEPGRVDYDASAPEQALHVSGSLGPHSGSGTTSTAMPALAGSPGAGVPNERPDVGCVADRRRRTSAGLTPSRNDR